jgi:riboflavin synthase
MFTGIIEGLGTVSATTPQQGGLLVEVRSDFDLTGVRIGDSIAVNGVCLTAVKTHHYSFTVEAAPETLAKSTMGGIKAGDRVNLERALRLGDRLDGHLVTGHVDGIGKVTARRPAGNAILFSFSVPSSLARFIVQKGSVAVDGTSLTVNACHPAGFEVSIIPHTAKITALDFRKIGDAVNIETDIIGKYVEQFTRNALGKSGGRSVDEALLAKTGFI